MDPRFASLAPDTEMVEHQARQYSSSFPPLKDTCYQCAKLLFRMVLVVYMDLPFPHDVCLVTVNKGCQRGHENCSDTSHSRKWPNVRLHECAKGKDSYQDPMLELCPHGEANDLSAIFPQTQTRIRSKHIKMIYYYKQENMLIFVISA